MRNNVLARLAGLALATSAHASLATLPELPPAPAGQAVSELLMIDARDAIAAERAKQQTSAQPAQPVPSTGSPTSVTGLPTTMASATPPVQSGPVLTAIYGVGNRLRAEVLIDGQHTLFANGRPSPLTGASTSWRLKRISPPCVDLESDDGAMRLCAARLGDAR